MAALLSHIRGLKLPKAKQRLQPARSWTFLYQGIKADSQS